MPAESAPEILFSHVQDESVSEIEARPRTNGPAVPRTNSPPASPAEPAAPRSSAAKQPHSVEFVDSTGTRWLVSERDTRNEVGARGDHCLVFTSGQIVRRVWNYPLWWRDLTADALSVLSWRR